MINIEELRADIEAGYVQWHSSEEDGGPDVGILLGLTDSQQLWFGEMLSADTDKAGWGFVLHGPGSDRTTFIGDYEVRELIEDWIAPLIRKAASLPQLEREYLAMREALAEMLIEFDIPAYAASDEIAACQQARKALGETQ